MTLRTSTTLSSSIDLDTSTTTSLWAVRPVSSTVHSVVGRLGGVFRRNGHHSSTSTAIPGDPQESILHSTTPKTFTKADRFSYPRDSPMTPKDRVEPTPTFQWIQGELLGKGSFGKVYLALNATTGDVMAVKQVELEKGISGASTKEQEMIDALKFESNTLKDLDHPHIVHYLGWEEGPEKLSIFMEYVSGGTIARCLAIHGAFRHETTKSFTIQMLKGLEYLHSRGIIHRDLKADNILVEDNGTCKISDFGISKRADEYDGRAFTGMKGTIYWMAPEIFSPNKEEGYDSKVDIWSIGCVVLEMWSAHRPWHGHEIYPVMYKIMHEKQPPPIPKNVRLSGSALDFRNVCFSFNPRMRPSAAELQRHPYLVLPPNWIFDGWGDEPSLQIHESEPTIHPVENTLRPSSSRSTARPGRPRKGSTKTLPPVPPVPTIPPILPNGQTAPQPNYNAAGPSQAATSSGPPVVFITPPSSPARTSPPWSPEETPSPSTSNSSARWSARRKKSFYVANPDQEEDYIFRRNRFIYSPPPLPSIGTASASYSRLSMAAPRRASSSMNIAKHAAPRKMPSTPALRTSAFRIMDSTPTYGNFSDSDSDSDVGTLWNKRPVNTNKSDDKDDRARKRQSRISRVGTKRDSAWERPGIKEIYQNLDQCFPGHDIDKLVFQDGDDLPSAAPSRSKSIDRRKKSMRMVAEERVHNPARLHRRGTKLWGSRLEQVVT